MEWWIEEEIRKYKGKKVRYNNTAWVVVEVFWDEKNEEFVYYIENSKKDFYKVYENNIQLITG